MNSKYIFKYDQNGELYNYVELNKFDKVISFFKIEGKKMLRFDRKSNTKQLTVFKSRIRLKQKFMSGESFVSVFKIDTDECIQYKLPERVKWITLINNKICVSDYGKFVVQKWKEMMQ